MRVLILCTGNSCRSQMAHGFLQSFDKSLEVHSAGTNPASQVNPQAIQVMHEVGIDISTHKPKSVEIYLNDEWDYVITVCGGANETCPMFVGKVGKRLHIGFDDPTTSCDLREYKTLRDIIKRKIAEFYISQILHKELPEYCCNQ
jgi:arsenate reductase